jgi:hypothetical protein
MTLRARNRAKIRKDAPGRGFKSRNALDNGAPRFLLEDHGTTIALTLAHEPRKHRAGGENSRISELRGRMTLIVEIGALALQGASAAEASLARSSAPGAGWVAIMLQIAGAASSLFFLALMVLLLPAVFRLRRTAAKFDKLLDHIERSVDPVTKHASRIADNIDYISTSIRADVQAIRKTLLVANEGIRDVVDSSERRLHELGAVLRLVQEEAEHAFVSTASTVRGARAGAAAFREDGERLANDGVHDDGDDENELEALDDDFDDFDDVDDVDDLDDSDLDAAADAAEDMSDGDDNGPAFERAEPRIKRPRRGGPG